MAVTAAQVPFTYTGNWTVHEWKAGYYYAKLLTSGTLTPKRNFTCDVFLVGGGGGGSITTHLGYAGTGGSGGGGGGGYTKNIYSINVVSATSVTIGSGGNGGSAGYATYFGNNNVMGGGAGGQARATSDNKKPSANGGDGGSGGGSARAEGGSNGSDGGAYTGNLFGGKGQNSTTRPFGGVDSFSSMLFAGGGGGSGATLISNVYYGYKGGDGGGGTGGYLASNDRTFNATSGTDNTGGGGGGGFSYYNSDGVGRTALPGNGGSGIVIIRGSLNTPPTTPGNLTYAQPKAGKPLTLTTSGSTDPDGDAIQYVFEHRVDSGVFSQVGVTAAKSVTATVPTSGTNYQARVKAVDSKGGESGYRAGAATPISYNATPTVSGQDEDLGACDIPPSYTYTVNDEDQTQTLTVTESVTLGSGELVLRTFVATRGQAYTAALPVGWLQLGAQAHTLIIKVEDGNGGTARRRIGFSRTVNRIAACRMVQTAQPVTKCFVSLFPSDRPAGSELHCEASNNPFDDNPVWEEITNKLGTYVHTFANTGSQTAGLAVRFWITKGIRQAELVQATVRYR